MADLIPPVQPMTEQNSLLLLFATVACVGGAFAVNKVFDAPTTEKKGVALMITGAVTLGSIVAARLACGQSEDGICRYVPQLTL